MAKWSDDPLLLFHGTTLHAANAINGEGWRPMDPIAIIDRIAAEHDVDSSAIVEDLTRCGRFLSVEEERGSRVSFATTFLKAEHAWAQRAPECVWEALWAVYRLKCMTIEDMPCWNKSVAGHAWVWEQMRCEALAVITFTTSCQELVALGALRGPSQALVPSAYMLDRWERIPEIGVDLPFRPDSERLTVTQVDRHLPWDIYAHRLGLADDEFRLRAARGDFGRPASDRVPSDNLHGAVRPWWNSSTAPFIGTLPASSAAG